MAFVTDRRTQSAVFVATGAMLLGLIWLGVVGTGRVEVSAGVSLVSFAAVTTVLVGVNLWLAWKAIVPLWRTARGQPEEERYIAAGPYHRKQRGLRR